MTKYLRSQIEELIKEWVIGRNSRRNRKIIHDSLIDGYSLKELAEKYKLSETRIKTIVRTFKRNVGMKE